jgi:hypothetical protein
MPSVWTKDLVDDTNIAKSDYEAYVQQKLEQNMNLIFLELYNAGLVQLCRLALHICPPKAL